MYTAPYTGGTRARSEQAYAALKTRLLRGEFLFGVRLAESRLAGLLEVSRTPVREALSRLHAEGLVDRHPQGGYCPTAPDLPTVRELYEVRFALELEAVSRPVRGGEPHDALALADLREDWSELDPPEVVLGEDGADVDPDFVLLDEDFHVRLADAAGNHALADLLGRVNERIRLVRMQDFLSAERVERTIEQHLGILDALEVGDLDLARARLVAHFDESVAVVEERAAAALARMLVAGRREVR